MARAYFEVGHKDLEMFPPVKVVVSDPTINWDNELIYPEHVLRELVHLGFHDMEDGKLKRNNAKLQRIVQNATGKRSDWMEEWGFYEFKVAEGLKNKDLLEHIDKNYCAIFIPKDGEVTCLLISFQLEKLKNDAKVKKYLSEFKEYEFGKVESVKRVIGKPTR